MDGGWQGGSRDAKTNVHPSRLTLNWRTVDAEGGFVPQVETDQQHLRQAWICKSLVFRLN